MLTQCGINLGWWVTCLYKKNMVGRSTCDAGSNIGGEAGVIDLITSYGNETRCYTEVNEGISHNI